MRDDSSPHHGCSGSNVVRPTERELQELAEELGFKLSLDHLRSFHGLVDLSLREYDTLARMPDHLPEVRYPRVPGDYQPHPADNPCNAWAQKLSRPIEGAASGPLLGKTVVLKDNMCLAGIPMRNGSRTLDGFVPDIDATVATRVLDAGARIVGKAQCEALCLDAGSHTSATGPVSNPHREGYSAGGSSSGCAALVALGAVDMAIGSDQGGSVRIPSSFCGTYGMKPTYGLVPYTGVMPIEPSLDHVGPITRTVEDNALLLSVIAGRDGLDHRQSHAVPSTSYMLEIDKGVRGMKIGVLKEGFGLPESEADTDRVVRGAAEAFAALGAEVELMSVSAHRLAMAVWTAIITEGVNKVMMEGNGHGYGSRELYVTSLMKAHSSWRQQPNELSEALKLTMLVARHMEEQYKGRFYAKAKNMQALITQAYDAALRTYDLLLLPTTAMKAMALPMPDSSHTEYVLSGEVMLGNTAPFDVSGHPAMNVPCGMVDGLPIGMMLVGKWFGEATIYRAAYAFARARGPEQG